MLVLASLFVGARLKRVGGGDSSRFVVAGSQFVDSKRAPSDLVVIDGAGYDGQFFYRFALDPSNLAETAHGIHVDVPLRNGRIGYPFLAFVLSAGRSSTVPLALVLLNIGALVALALLGGAIARDAGRHVIWGLFLALFFGFVFSLARDLSEILEAAFLVSGLYSLRRSKPLLAGLALTAAVLVREAALLFVAAYALWRIWELLHRRARPGVEDVPWVLPGVGFVIWQLVCVREGPLPITHGGGDGIAFPGSELVEAVPNWAHRIGTGSGALQVAEAATLVLIVVLAAIAVTSRTTSALAYERLGFAFLVVFALCVSTPIGPWNEQFDFRVFADLFVLAWIVLLGTRIRLLLPTVGIVACWLGAAALRTGTV